MLLGNLSRGDGFLSPEGPTLEDRLFGPGCDIGCGITPDTFEAYGRGRRLIAVERTASPERVAPAVEALLTRPEVDYLHVRNTEAGCYILRIERA